MNAPPEVTPAQRTRALVLVTLAFAVCFAVWVIFSIIGVQLQAELGFSQTAFGLLVATPILTGSLTRLALGIWSEMFGGRRVLAILMLVVAACAYAVPYARTYPMLLLVGLGVGLAGGAFSVGVVYVSSWFPKERQGSALGLFGMGNSGAALTSFGAPLLLAVMDWRQVTRLYATLMLGAAVLFWLVSQEDPLTRSRRASAAAPVPLGQRLEPLRKLQVWRFSFYYFLVFGGFVALTSWLPRYYVGAHGLDIKAAGMLTAAFALPAALFRAYGGTLSDRFGARAIMYLAFGVSMLCLFLLSYPDTRYVVNGIRGPIEFSIAPGLGQRAAVLFVLGTVLSFGAAAVFKHIPTYYPNHVGGVGGLVGMIGGLGGFFLPIAFGFLNDRIGIWTSCFMLLFAIASVNLLWMHFAIQRINRSRFPELRRETDLPELMQVLSAAEQAERAAKLAAEAAQAAALAAQAARAARSKAGG